MENRNLVKLKAGIDVRRLRITAVSYTVRKSISTVEVICEKSRSVVAAILDYRYFV